MDLLVSRHSRFAESKPHGLIRMVRLSPGMSRSRVGVRPALGVTQFPAGVTTAATWDRELFYNRSLAMGQEFRDQGVVSYTSSFEGLTSRDSSGR